MNNKQLQWLFDLTKIQITFIRSEVYCNYQVQSIRCWCAVVIGWFNRCWRCLFFLISRLSITLQLCRIITSTDCIETEKKFNLFYVENNCSRCLVCCVVDAAVQQDVQFPLWNSFMRGIDVSKIQIKFLMKKNSCMIYIWMLSCVRERLL